MAQSTEDKNPFFFTYNPEKVLKTFPNPFYETLVFTLENSKAKNLTYIVKDVTGNSLIHGTTNKEKVELNTSELREGIYFLMLIQDNGAKEIQRIIKK